jgi:hypothetical protein
MDAKAQIEKTVKGEKEPEHAHAVQTAQAAPPMPVVKPPLVAWMPPSTVPGHDTEIRHWGINE